jgi:hypothetical protein
LKLIIDSIPLKSFKKRKDMVSDEMNPFSIDITNVSILFDKYGN